MDSFDKLYDQIKDVFDDGKLTTIELISITPRVIKFVQKLGEIRQLSGIEKKHLFFQLIDKLIDKSSIGDSEKELIKQFVDNILPTIVDAVVMAYKSKDFQKMSKNCLKSCIKN